MATVSAVTADDGREDKILTLGFLADESKAGEAAVTIGASEDDGAATVLGCREDGVEGASSLSSDWTTRLRRTGMEGVEFDEVVRPISSLSATFPITLVTSCSVSFLEATAEAIAGAVAICTCFEELVAKAVL